MKRGTRIISALGAVGIAATLAYAPAASADRVGFNVTFAGPGYAVNVGNRGVAVGYYAPPVVYPAPPVAYPPAVVYPAPVVVAPPYVAPYRPYPVYRPYYVAPHPVRYPHRHRYDRPRHRY